MASIDLKDCFWALPVHERDQRYLAFRWRGKKYTFNCLPFGLSLSPMFITKLYRHVVEHLQSKGHRVIMYIDDMLILADTKEKCRASALAARALLEDLGAIISEDKSSFTPTQRATYLGFELDSKDMKIWVPAKKMANLRKSIKQFIREPKASARQAASVLGKLTSMADALFPVRLRTTALHDFKLRALGASGKDWDQAHSLPATVVADLKWWLDNLFSLNGRPIHPPKTDIKAATDASDFGWGAWVETPTGIRSWGGLFPKDTANKHINYKELLAIYHFLTSCPISLQDKVVDLGVDNTTALHYVKHMGGRKGYLAHLATKIFDCLTRTRTTLIGYHLPGEKNTIADRESRRTIVRATDFKLKPSIFGTVDSKWGPHTVDLFASLEDRQLRRFCSWEPQPEALWIDAMARPWTNENAWVNPPFSMIGRILQKVEMEGTTITLVAPLWPAQPWFPRLVQMLVAAPLVLPQLPDLFQHPLKARCKTPNWLTVVWRISGAASAKKASTRRPSTWFASLGPHQLWPTMTAIGGVGRCSPALVAKIHALRTTLFLVHG